MYDDGSIPDFSVPDRPAHAYDFPVQVTQHLWLSPIFFTDDLVKWCLEDKFTHLINAGGILAYRRYPTKPDHLNYLQLNIDDKPEYDISSDLVTSYDFIQEAIDQSGKILCHCFWGQSRSVSVIIYYLMKTQGVSYDLALSKIRTVRPEANPNEGFVSQLQKFDFIKSSELKVQPSIQSKMQIINDDREDTKHLIVEAEHTLNQVSDFITEHLREHPSLAYLRVRFPTIRMAEFSSLIQDEYYLTIRSGKAETVLVFRGSQFDGPDHTPDHKNHCFSVSVIPYNLTTGEVFMLGKRRGGGARSRLLLGTMTETVEKGEFPEDTILRGLQEELGTTDHSGIISVGFTRCPDYGGIIDHNDIFLVLFSSKQAELIRNADSSENEVSMWIDPANIDPKTTVELDGKTCHFSGISKDKISTAMIKKSAEPMQKKETSYGWCARPVAIYI